MKKTLLLFAFLAFAAASYGRAVNLNVVYLTGTSDSIKWNTGGTISTTFKYGFINLGPDTLRLSDTIYLRHLNVSGTGNLEKLHLLAGAPVHVGDTVKYTKTFSFNNVNTGGNPTLNFCDSVWIVDVANVVLDNVTTNNKVCKTMTVWQDLSGVEELFGANKINSLDIYPNPATSNISFKYDLKGGEGTVVIRDIVGKVVYQQKLEASSGEQVANINVNGFANGVYITELSSEHIKSLGRVVIQK